MKHIVSIFFFLASVIIAHAQSITPEQARDSFGKNTTVCGSVTGVNTAASGVTFLNMGRKYPDNAFTMVVFKGDTAKFTYRLAAMLEGKEICVTGLIKDFKGKPEIVADSEKQIVVKKEERE